jgi:hypothetical protein
MSHAACYIERADAGASLRSLRLVHARGQAHWTAPRRLRDAADATAPDAASVRAALTSAAAWIAQQLNTLPGTPRLTLVLDLDAARCGWLNANSSDDASVALAVQDALAAEPGDHETTASRLSWLDTLRPGADASAQALVAPARAPSRRARRAANAANAPSSPATPNADPAHDRRRLALLAVPDLAARLLIDELDRLGIEPYSVTSLWHLMALAWEPGGADAAAADARRAASRPGAPPATRTPSTKSNAKANGTTNGTSSVVDADTSANGAAALSPEALSVDPSALAVATDDAPGTSPVCATLLVDTQGHLAWSWSRRGQLLAAGSIRLRRSVVESAETASSVVQLAQLAPSAASAAPAPAPATAASGESGGTLALTELSRSDIGRLVGDWLAWSLELGVAPSRVVGLARPDLICGGLDDDLPGVSAIVAGVRALARAWPGTVATAQAHDDPVAETLRAGVVALNDLTSATRDQAAPDPRAAMPELMRRPGRATRSAYRWQGVLALCCAGAITALGVKLQLSAGDLQQQLNDAATKQREAIARVEKFVPTAANPGLPADEVIRDLDTRLKTFRAEGEALVPEKPIFNELVRLINAAETPEGESRPELARVTLASVGFSQVELRAPDAAAGPLFLNRLEAQSPTTAYVNWTSTSVTNSDGTRIFRLRAQTGQPWLDPRPAPKAGAPNNAAPAPTPAPAR